METQTVKITQKEKEIFDYLNDLRESGITNMFGAGPYVSREFGIDKHRARNIVSKWMDNFNEQGYSHLL